MCCVFTPRRKGNPSRRRAAGGSARRRKYEGATRGGEAKNKGTLRLNAKRVGCTFLALREHYMVAAYVRTCYEGTDGGVASPGRKNGHVQFSMQASGGIYFRKPK